MRGSALARLCAPVIALVGCGRLRFDPVDAADPPADVLADVARDDATLDARDDGSADATVDAGRSPYCQAIPALAGPPTIDGVLEPGVVLEPIVPMFWTGASAIPAGQSAQLGMGWTAEGVYFFVSVEDRTSVVAPMTEEDYCGDGAELYLDWDGVNAMAPMYDDPGTRQFIVAAAFGTGTRANRATGYVGTDNRGAWRSTQFGAFGRSAGYVVEALVTARDLGLPAGTPITTRVGFDISINVSPERPSAGACGGRLGQYFLRALGTANSAHPYLNSGAFCTARLVPR
ncbi:MAG: hypothetical protein JNK05_23585 [Myxococcales bacterium]|nr:hypothetical protein [Myxococcales bacterium]